MIIGTIKIGENTVDASKLTMLKLTAEGIEIEYYDSTERAVINKRFCHRQNLEIHIESKVD